MGQLVPLHRALGFTRRGNSRACGPRNARLWWGWPNIFASFWFCCSLAVDTPVDHSRDGSNPNLVGRLVTRHRLLTPGMVHGQSKTPVADTRYGGPCNNPYYSIWNTMGYHTSTLGHDVMFTHQGPQWIPPPPVTPPAVGAVSQPSHPRILSLSPQVTHLINHSLTKS
jgi:hypothetical protein